MVIALPYAIILAGEAIEAAAVAISAVIVGKVASDQLTKMKEQADSRTLTPILQCEANPSSQTSTGMAMQEGPRQLGYIPAPKELPGFPDAKPTKPKTPNKAGKLRKRWKTGDGDILEWDSQHGKVEKYDKRGNHKGEYDPETGEQTKPPDKGRRVEP